MMKMMNQFAHMMVLDIILATGAMLSEIFVVRRFIESLDFIIRNAD